MDKPIEADILSLYTENGGSLVGTGYSQQSSVKRYRAAAQNMLRATTFTPSICDFGCGYGGFLEYCELSGVVPREYVGCDLRESLLEANRQKHPQHTWVTHIPDRQFEVMIALGVFSHRIAEPASCKAIWKKEIKTLWAKTESIMIFTLARRHPKVQSDQTLTYWQFSDLAFLNELTPDWVIDGHTFPHEIFVVLRK